MKNCGKVLLLLGALALLLSGMGRRSGEIRNAGESIRARRAPNAAAQ